MKVTPNGVLTCRTRRSLCIPTKDHVLIVYKVHVAHLFLQETAVTKDSTHVHLVIGDVNWREQRDLCELDMARSKKKLAHLYV